MLGESEITLEYDGSFQGFLCCVHHIFSTKLRPIQIYSTKDIRQSLFTPLYIETNENLARRIWQRLTSRLSERNLEFIRKGFCTTNPIKEILLISAIEIALSFNDSLSHHTYDANIQQLTKDIKTFNREIQHYQGFTRFSDIDNFLVAIIEPKEAIMAYLLPFFVSRFANEQLAIFDQKNQILGLYQDHTSSFHKIESIPAKVKSATETDIENQWRTFFQAVSIKERENPRCQMSHMPKRFWEFLPEMESK